MSDQVTIPAQTQSKVWIIFQGDEGKDIVKDLSDEFLKCSNEKNIIFHCTSFHPDNAEGSVYKRVQQDAAECNAAIAIIANDLRGASTAGNLWFEIGLWLAQRPSDRLIICKKENVTLDSKHNELITDINGKVVPSFTNNETLWNHIFKFVTTLDLKPKKNNQSTQYNKIDDIYNKNKSSMWLTGHSYHCHSKNNQVCSFREQSFEFSAELLRMGKVNRERELLALIISRIATYSGMYRTEKEECDNKNIPFKLTNKRRKILKNLNKSLVKIIDFDAKINSPHYSDQREPLERVSMFLTYRLETCCNLFEEFRKRDEVYESEDELKTLVTRGIKTFIDFVKCYGDHRQLLIDYAEQDTFCNEIRELSYDSEKMAKFLYALGDIYYTKCSKVLNGGIKQMIEPDIFRIRIQEMISALPHNDLNEHHQSNWHSSIISSSEVK